MGKIVYSTLRFDSEDNTIYSHSESLSIDQYGILHILPPEIVALISDVNRIAWDGVDERLYETGVDRGVLYLKNPNGVYDTGVAWNGINSITESPSGAEPTNIYADNVKYVELRSKEEFKGTIEAYTYPDRFSECDGSSILKTGLHAGQQTRKPFGLCYRTLVNGGKYYKLHLVYDCMASPSERSYKSINDSPEAVLFSWEFSSTPVKLSDQKPVSTLTIDSSKVNLNRLHELEDALYGTSSSSARLPFPDEVISILAGRSMNNE